MPGCHLNLGIESIPATFDIGISARNHEKKTAGARCLEKVNDIVRSIFYSKTVSTKMTRCV